MSDPVRDRLDATLVDFVQFASKGPDAPFVAVVQYIVGAKVDGIPGPETRAKMLAWVDAKIAART